MKKLYQFLIDQPYIFSKKPNSMLKLFKKIRKQYKYEAYLLIIICIAFYLRTFNINWDNGYYFHPDERALIMTSLPVQFPTNLADILSVESSLNPHFFAYGSLPIYLLKICAEIFGLINPVLKAYGGIHIVGRLISASFDTATVFVVYLICAKLFSKKVGLLSSLLYCFSVLPIQLSHFFAVDTILTFFMTTTILWLIHFTKKPSNKNAFFAGIFFGFSLSTKISALILIPVIIISLMLSLHQNKKNKRIKSKNIEEAIIFTLSSAIIFFCTQPYAIIDFREFAQQTTAQTQMSNNAFIFPYTLQYVGKIPYLYELKNIFLWGLGPVIGLLSASGIVYMTLKQGKKIVFMLPAVFLFVYFFIFGKFAVGFIRYMLPVYPMFTIFAGWFLSEIVIKFIPKKYFKNYLITKSLIFLLVMIISIYPVSFLSIYLHANTRIQASDWINKNIPQGSRLAIEHWDDSLPVYGMQNYTQLTLPLYDPDTKDKWSGIDSTLRVTDYIIIASGRLYIPLQKLTDCKKLPDNRCYPLTASYYKKLFSGELGFRKIAEFKSEPTIPILNIHINDVFADENFTVFDHPKIMIFKKE